MTIEERINDDLRQLSAELHFGHWVAAKEEKSDEETPKQRPEPAGKGKSESDLKNKASRLLDLMISLGEIERRGGRKSS